MPKKIKKKDAPKLIFNGPKAAEFDAIMNPFYAHDGERNFSEKTKAYLKQMRKDAGAPETGYPTEHQRRRALDEVGKRGMR